ncbi:hypothetical protein [Chroococcidiopsis sp. CCMEE 29]|uniref:hypothetical protein n=1 Tax=Chroococcidiopsis sp. CCMEE 29 TaxID=155894 RepID=UPI00202098ED|nr:hypothetical protein [Chroococcidiopsis sp. CCMEE 29]
MTNSDEQNGKSNNFDNQSEQPDSIQERLRRYLESDPDNLLWTTHIENYPMASFAFIAIARLEGRTWQKISDSLGGIPIGTLGIFYQHYVQQFYPQIRNYLNNDNPDNSNFGNDNL